MRTSLAVTSKPENHYLFPSSSTSFALSTCTTQVRTGSSLAALLCTLVSEGTVGPYMCKYTHVDVRNVYVFLVM